MPPGQLGPGVFFFFLKNARRDSPGISLSTKKIDGPPGAFQRILLASQSESAGASEFNYVCKIPMVGPSFEVWLQNYGAMGKTHPNKFMTKP